LEKAAYSSARGDGTSSSSWSDTVATLHQSHKHAIAVDSDLALNGVRCHTLAQYTKDCLGGLGAGARVMPRPLVAQSQNECAVGPLPFVQIMCCRRHGACKVA
jgi:hypothetical protein